MKFEDLSTEHIQTISELYKDTDISWDERMNRLSSYLNRSERTVAKWLVKLGLTERSIQESPQLIKAKGRQLSEKKRFLITWAQNDTPVNEAFVSNLEEYAYFIDADIHVIAGRYKNPTSVFTDIHYDTWSDRILQYLDANRHNVHKHAWIMSDIKIQPTATDPMTGLRGLTGVHSCVFGSPKVQFETVPVLEGNLPKMMMTTGACTVSNYTDSKAGKKGEFHHTLGFVIVEIKDDDTFFMRQVTATDDGNFYDLNHMVTYDESEGISTVESVDTIEAIILGDVHFGQQDQLIIDKTLNLFKVLRPNNVILHDVFDGLSINHHDAKNPFIQYERELNGTNSLRDEVESMLEGLEAFESYRTIIVRSNHDDFLDRWLQTADWRKSGTLKNSLEYMEYSALLLRGAAPSGVIPYLIKCRFPNFITLGRNDSFVIRDWELGQHGDIGASGTRGSILQFRHLNTKIVVGHYHSPARMDGALAVGTSTTLRVNYNIGPSSWLQSHVIIQQDGKAQHLNFINGEFTTLFKL
jgi:hypothetical protein